MNVSAPKLRVETLQVWNARSLEHFTRRMDCKTEVPHLVHSISRFCPQADTGSAVRLGSLWTNLPLSVSKHLFIVERLHTLHMLLAVMVLGSQVSAFSNAIDFICMTRGITR